GRARRRAGEASEPEAALRADALLALVTRRAGNEPQGAGTDPDRDPEGGTGGGGASPGAGDDSAGDDSAGDDSAGDDSAGDDSASDDSASDEGAPRRRAANPRPGPAPVGPTDGRGPVDPEALALVESPPPCSVVVRVDLDVLFGAEEPTEGLCELEGMGPVPAAMARDLLNDAFLRMVFHRAGDIRAVSHFGRTIKASLRTALVDRDRRCVVPGCLFSTGLEIDHVVPVTENGPTELDNLALLCHHHHFLKTYGGWTLTRTGTKPDGTPEWSFVPQPSFGQEPGLGLDTPEGRQDWHRQKE
ncbi:MAG: HNH endonuclease signature motif containing protein, partial [Acidimicrobiales bacterium]